MTKTIIKLIFSILLIIDSLSAQRETVGVEYNQHDRDIDSLSTKSNIGLMSYRKELPSGMRLAVSLGLDYVKLFANDAATNPMLKSTNQIFVQLEGMQKIQFLYLKGAAQFYTVKGNAVEITDGYSELLHNNIYRILEFPLGVGFTFSNDVFDFYIGLNKTYFYGTSEKEIIVNNGGNETSLGSTVRETFKTDLELGADVTVLYRYTDQLDFEINLTKYKKEDFSVRFSIWGPLQRMLWTK